MPESVVRSDVTWRPAAVFAAVFAALVLVASEGSRRLLPPFADRYDLVTRATRPDSDYYLAHDSGGHIDHHVIYFGTDARVLERLRAASVLFLGNSRAMFALRPDVLRPFFAERGLSYYVMGFGYREADAFPLAIIRKFDLRPKLVVVNADGFFGGGLSEWAQIVVRDSPFAARKRQIEGEYSHELRRGSERVIPNWLSLFGLPGMTQRRSFIAYRSRSDGTWVISPWPVGRQGFVLPSDTGPPLSRGEIAAARQFKAELDRRGSRLLLVRVPTPEPMPGGGPARFAELLGVPYLAPAPPAPTSFDSSHLSPGSAHDWSRLFTDALGEVLDSPGPADPK